LSDVKLFSLVDIYRYFGEMFCLHIQGKKDMTEATDEDLWEDHG